MEERNIIEEQFTLDIDLALDLANDMVADIATGDRKCDQMDEDWSRLATIVSRLQGMMDNVSERHAQRMYGKLMAINLLITWLGLNAATECMKKEPVALRVVH